MGEQVIQTDGLTKRYGKLVAVDQVTLAVPAGGVFALMGRNGAGKTSLIRMLLGLTPVTDGSASVLGLDSARDHVKVRQRVGYVPETHHMYRWMKVREITRFSSAFYPTWDTPYCDELLDGFALDREQKVRALSRGMVAKLALTLALAHRPQVLVLDEPTSGLDAVVRREFLESIVNVAADEGRTVLLSSHLLKDVERVVDTVALIDGGKIQLVEDLEGLQARVREVRITFPGECPPVAVDVPGVLSFERTPREWVLTVKRFGPDTMAELTQKLPGATCEVRNLDLEEIFVTLVGRPGAEGDR